MTIEPESTNCFGCHNRVVHVHVRPRTGLGRHFAKAVSVSILKRSVFEETDLGKLDCYGMSIWKNTKISRTITNYHISEK